MGTPPGLHYVEFEENDTMREVDRYIRSLNYVTPAKSNRKVVQFGPIYDYEARKIRAAVTPIPDEFAMLLELIADQLSEHKIESPTFTQCIVNRYIPGEGISAHTDLADFGPVVACITFGAPADMVFRKMRGPGPAEYIIRPAPCSLYIMSGAARTNYTHEMPARKSDPADVGREARGVRYSATFRSVLPGRIA